MYGYTQTHTHTHTHTHGLGFCGEESQTMLHIRQHSTADNQSVIR